MAKKKKEQQEQPAQPLRKRAASDPERWTRFWLIGGVVAVLAVVVGLIGFGWYQTQIAPRGKTVLQVGETKYDLRHLERRMKLSLEENALLAQSRDFLQVLPDTVLSDLEREAKLLEAARTLGIAVTEEGIDAQVREQGGLAESVDPRDFAAEFRRQVDESGLHSDEYRQMLRAELLAEKVTQHFTDNVVPTEPQVRARWIVTAEDGEAEEAVARLEAGEAFAEVAADVSQDQVSAENGGEIDWRARGTFHDARIGDFLFEAEPGGRSDVISTHLGAYVVELIERDESRELVDVQLQQVITRDFNGWLAGLDITLDIIRDLTAEDRVRALNDVL